MRGLPSFNFPAFEAAAAALRAKGYEVWSPAEADMQIDGFHPDENTTREPHPFAVYMQRDLPAVCAAHAVAVLPGWEHSQGARLEVFVCRAVGHGVFTVDSLIAGAPAAPEVQAWTAYYQRMVDSV